ncbi:5'-methylthioadenosine phosphorylase [Rubellimicrobium mesophilum DSM 19309]|uniref:S-methyl-5'-thioadenosine phosphorylase n=1 Tax=Rubellimicrobium mesophilum DSM 19309 TaxID=442562 RepID=A0A017HVN2_9RHOB|nr:S-methyl-5'-thioadenosine phosphorylase [Rubellimicrobium mesophilum]EYD77819.1 5'-methylthioadenosine phosphorylase [Rubellimicrobium mesophilum DSM 19309]
MATHLGLIGGSGLYGLPLEGAEWREVDTPWGAPSDAILTGTLDGLPVSFLPRHGRGHVHAPGELPSRANVAALKALGVTDVLSISAVGSFREAMAPGHLVVVDQIVDRTVARPASFFGTGCVAHVSLAQPTCPRLSALAAEAAEATGATVHRGGTYLCMEGPQFSSRAESRIWRDSWGCDVIGMTAMPEARLAREAELCYAIVAMVTDYDSWLEGHGAVDVSAVLAVLAANVARGRDLALRLPGRLGPDAPGQAHPCPHGCDRALDHAVMTAPDRRDPSLVERLRAVAGRVL